ncbi:MAG: hypothetical protein DYH03_04610 [Nitrospira sp. NTP1]|nr:hypothetical protein [Nitrospira sp. NTP1]
MKFVILGFDGPEGQAKRKIHRAAHLAKLEPLDRQGRVLLAGPFTDLAGSLIIIDTLSSKYSPIEHLRPRKTIAVLLDPPCTRTG